MYYTIYETTNLINGKKYVGYHKTNNLEDGYLGSGKLLKLAIKKYGKENFRKRILFVYQTKDEALLAEKNIVNEDFVKTDFTYNVKIGGEGGFDYINEKIKIDDQYKSKFYEKVKYGVQRAYNEGKCIGWSKNKSSSYWKGKNLTEEHKKKIKDNNKNVLDANVIQQRIKDYNEIEKTIGWVSKLASKWNVSHTQVSRFLKNHISK